GDGVEAAIAQVIELAHPRALIGMTREQRRGRKRIFEIFANDAGVRDDAAVVQNQGRHFGALIDAAQVLVAVERVAALDRLVGDTLVVEHHLNLARVGTGRKSKQLHRSRLPIRLVVAPVSPSRRTTISCRGDRSLTSESAPVKAGVRALAATISESEHSSRSGTSPTCIRAGHQENPLPSSRFDEAGKSRQVSLSAFGSTVAPFRLHGNPASRTTGYAGRAAGAVGPRGTARRQRG